MKVRRIGHQQVEFKLSRKEHEVLLAVLNLYPRVVTPPGGKGTGPLEASQRLLEEALSEHRRQTRRDLEAWLKDPTRWREHGASILYTFSETEAEMLLQVLNDIRIGSWIALGSPEERRPPLTEKTAPDIWAMELAGHFQMALLEGLGSGKWCV